MLFLKLNTICVIVYTTMVYDCYKFHEDIDKKLNDADITCNFHIHKQVSPNLCKSAKFVAITCLFRMSNAYRNFAKYIDPLTESCELNKNNPIIIRIYYDKSTEQDILNANFSKNKNVELVRYEFPRLRDINGEGHQGTFGTFMRQLSLFNFAHNSVICTCFDADMILDYKEICRCINKMNAHNAPYFTLYYDNLQFDNIAERVSTNVFDDFTMATYIAQTNKISIPYIILTNFIKEMISGSTNIYKWLEQNKHIRSNMKSTSNFIYGVDEFFINSYLLPYIHSKYNVIGTRLYIHVRQVHYELYKAIKSKKIASHWFRMIITKLLNIFAKFKLTHVTNVFDQIAMDTIISEVDGIIDKKINIFKSLNMNIDVLHHYLFLLIELKNKEVVKFSQKYNEYLEFNERTKYIDDIFIVHYAATALGAADITESDKNVWIIVPYADLHPEQKRAEQLRKFLAHMKMLNNKLPILIAEQTAPLLFNKGKLYNIAIRWLSTYLHKNAIIDTMTDPRIILHDVDILPNKDMFMQYSSPNLETPMQMVPMSTYFKKIYDPKFPIPVGGGITAIKLSDYIRINGFPNNFAGWGGEDNAFQIRLKQNHIYYHYNSIGDFTTTDVQRTDIHSKKKYIDTADIQNKKIKEKLAYDRVNWEKSGINQLNQLSCKTELYKESEVLIHIKINCANTEINAGAPVNSKIDVLVVIPFADFKPEQKRAEQLLQFTQHIDNLIKGMPSYANRIAFIVAEQISQKNYFNRGQLLNSGIKWYVENIATPNFVILHDVDMLPDATLFAEYFKSKNPISLVPQDKEYLQKYGKVVLVAGGGIFGLQYTDFVKCNGYPNTFWSWGGEDDAFCKRLANVGITKYDRVRRGHIKHIDVQRQSHQYKMDYLRKNKIRSMMVHENLDRDEKEWRTDGYANIASTVIDSPTNLSKQIYQVKFELSSNGLDVAIAHNAKVYKELENKK